MAIIAERAAGKIAVAGTGIMVKELLDVAGFAKGAVNWKGERDILCQRSDRADKGKAE